MVFGLKLMELLKILRPKIWAYGSQATISSQIPVKKKIQKNCEFRINKNDFGHLLKNGEFKKENKSCKYQKTAIMAKMKVEWEVIRLCLTNALQRLGSQERKIHFVTDFYFEND